MPVGISTVLRAKNSAAAFFILLEVGLVALFCVLLRMPVTAYEVAEALSVTLVLTVFLLAIGNLLSVRYPAAIDPSRSWRSGSMGRVQAFLLGIYPVVSAPVILAYGARYAFDSQAAFFAVLLLDLVVGVILYSIALESAVDTALDGRERIVQALSNAEGPVGG
jgi:ABC-2 type transport system permease protein